MIEIPKLIAFLLIMVFLFDASLLGCVGVYAAISAVESVAASAFDCVGEGTWMIEHRAPFLVLDFTVSWVSGTDSDGRQFGYSADGEYCCYGRTQYEVGQRMLTVDVYNPFSNYFDDILDVLVFSI